MFNWAAVLATNSEVKRASEDPDNLDRKSLSPYDLLSFKTEVFMAQEDTFKITYATLSAPSEEMHLEYDRAIEKVRKGMGNTHAMWIDGREVSGRDTFDNQSPADTGLVIGRFQDGAPEDAAAAVDAAFSGFPSWSHTPWDKRVELMLKAADIISGRRFELAALMSYEVGKNRFEALGDVEEGADLIRYYCKQIEDADGFDRPMGKLSPNEKTRDVLRPYGVWVVISPFNFPPALPAGMMADALIAGNTVVFKPAPDSSSTAVRLYEALREAGLPLDHQLFREELFVPLLTIGEVGSLGEAFELANRTEYGLTAGIFSEDREEIELFLDRIQAGATFANRRSGATTGAWPGVNPFCGWKASGASGKGVCGPYYVQQFLREQSQTVLE